MPDPRVERLTSPPPDSDRTADDGPGHPADDLARRIRQAAPGLAPLVAQAAAVQAARAAAYGPPRWTDVFTTQFTEFSNRPRLRPPR